MRRTDGGWEELSWDDALDLCAEGIRDLQRRHGRDSLAVYLGNPTVHNLPALLYGPDLQRTLRTRQRYSATSADQLPHMMVANHVFGHQLLMPVPDVDRTDWLLILGANPAASNGSILTGGDVERRLKGIRSRGGRVVLIDPRRTESARLADAHHIIRPGTDALLLAAMLQSLREAGRVRLGRLGPHVDGLDTLWPALRPFTPAAVAPLTGIPAETIVALAEGLADAKRGVVYGRFGVSTQRFGGLCQWLIVLLNLCTGHLDVPGGAMFARPAVDPLGRLKLAGQGGFGAGRAGCAAGRR